MDHVDFGSPGVLHDCPMCGAPMMSWIVATGVANTLETGSQCYVCSYSSSQIFELLPW